MADHPWLSLVQDELQQGFSQRNDTKRLSHRTEDCSYDYTRAHHERHTANRSLQGLRILVIGGRDGPVSPHHSSPDTQHNAHQVSPISLLRYHISENTRIVSTVVELLKSLASHLQESSLLSHPSHLDEKRIGNPLHIRPSLPIVTTMGATKPQEKQGSQLVAPAGRT